MGFLSGYDSHTHRGGHRGAPCTFDLPHSSFPPTPARSHTHTHMHVHTHKYRYAHTPTSHRLTLRFIPVAPTPWGRLLAHPPLPAGTSPPWHSASSELCSRHHGPRPGETVGPSSPSPRLLLPVLRGAIWGWSLGPGEPGKGSWAGLAGPLSLTLHPPGGERL